MYVVCSLLCCSDVCVGKVGKGKSVNIVMTRTGMGKFEFISGIHNELGREPFMVMDYNTTEGGTGHPGFLCHKQPAIEKHLRCKMEQAQHSQLRLGATVTSIREDTEWTYITYASSPTGQERQLRSKFLVGADGKTGFTRKHYLEPRGITLDQVTSSAYSQTWVALNWKISLPNSDTHPDFPLWRQGYTPQQVYDLFFPNDFRFLCNPQRAAVCGRFGLPADRLWRFEFVVLEGEDGVDMAGREKIQQVVYPYITHPGSKYGLDGYVRYPLDCIEVLRCRPFSFSARSCNKWALSRVALVGDAAHVFPPFGGQGIASGFRDAMGLAWRLALLTQTPPQSYHHPYADSKQPTTCNVNHQRLLQGWYTERKQQLDHSLASTIENGAYVCETDSLKIFVRDWYLWGMQLVPSWKRWLEQGNRKEGLTRYEWQERENMAFLPGGSGGGKNFPQVYCVGVTEKEEKKGVRFTDDVIFGQGKKGLFRLVIFIDGVLDLHRIQPLLNDIESVSGGMLGAAETTFFLKTTKMIQTSWTLPTQHPNVYRLATGQEFAASPLCQGRPEPQYYEPDRIWRESDRKQFVILRPDRFVFATCKDLFELKRAAAKLMGLVSDGWVEGGG
ncbi:hypothetical protein J4E82_008203 [Alternaria postmessia]|uniref:uncharacterized protein n=1 Tax=Alternaria postmessia TaxID=1187938 RepID=UPI0022251013|nr:uncharacterized protein J4E82_008203 [Alternaria postmessia]KAI5373103.1 hypothetical protein J4E82_008203 [Alternaria postmessia]